MKKVLFSTVAIVILSSSVAFAASQGFNDLMNRRGQVIGQLDNVSNRLAQIQRDLDNLNRLAQSTAAEKDKFKKDAVRLTLDAANAANGEAQMLMSEASKMFVNPEKRKEMLAEGKKLAALTPTLFLEAKTLEQK